MACYIVQLLMYTSTLFQKHFWMFTCNIDDAFEVDGKYKGKTRTSQHGVKIEATINFQTLVICGWAIHLTLNILISNSQRKPNQLHTHCP